MQRDPRKTESGALGALFIPESSQLRHAVHEHISGLCMIPAPTYELSQMTENGARRTHATERSVNRRFVRKINTIIILRHRVLGWFVTQH